jgi:hypothetical protein
MANFKIKLFCRIVFVFFVCIIGTTYWLFHKVMNIENLKTTIAQEIESATGMPVKIGKAEFALLEGLGIHLENITIGQKGEQSTPISLKELWINLAPAPLLSKKVKIKKISLRNPSFKTFREENGQFKISGWNGLLNASSSLNSEASRELDMGESPTLIVRDGEMLLIDRQLANLEPIQINHLNIIAQKPLPEAPINLSLFGEIPSNNGSATTAISGKLFESSQTKFKGKLALQNLCIDHLKFFLRSSNLPFKDISISLDGDFSIDLKNTVYFSGEARYQTNSIDSNSEIKFPSQGIIKIKLKWNSNNFELEKFDFKSDPIDLKGSLLWANYALPESRITLAAETSSVSANTISQYLPQEWIKENPSLLNFKDGSVSVQSLKFDESSSDWSNWNWSQSREAFTGNLLFKKADWDLDGFQLKEFDGLLKVNSGKADLSIERSICPKLGKAELKGKILDIFGQDPQMDIEFQGNPSPDNFIKDLRSIIPNPLFVKAVSRFENTHGLGALKGRLKGPLKFNDDSDLSVSYKIAKAGFNDKQTGLPYRNIDGLLEIKHEKQIDTEGAYKAPWKIIYSGFKGQFGDGLISNLQGNIILDDNSPSIKSSAKLSINAKSIPKLLSNRLGEKWFSNLQKVNFIDGRVIVDFFRNGPILNDQWGNYTTDLEFKDVAFNFHNSSATIRKVSGNAKISNEKLILQKLVGNWGESPFQIEGAINQLTHKNPSFDLTIDSLKLTPENLPQTPFFKKIHLTGNLGIRSNLKGTFDDFQFITELDLDSTGYKFPTFEKIPGDTNSITMEGRLNTSNFVEFKTFKYKIQDAIVRGSGKLNLFDSQDFIFNLFGENISIKSIASNFSPLEAMESGVANISLKGNGAWTSLENLKYEGTVKLGDASFKAEGFTHPLILNANLDLENYKSTINSATLASSDSAVQFTGNYEWNNAPSLNLTISGKKVDFNDVWPGVIPLEKIRKILFKSPLYNNGTATVEFQLGYYEFLFWTLNNPSGKIQLKDKSFNIEDFKILHPNGGLVEVGARFSFPETSGIQVDSFLSGSKIQAQDFLSIFGKTFDNGLTGSFDKLEGAFQVQGNTWKKFRKSFNAQLDFDLTAGTFDPNKLLKGASDLFNFSYTVDSDASKASDDRPYQNIAAGFRVKNGVAQTEDFRYLNNTRGMTLAGVFDLNKNEMDTVVGVAHLPGVDKVLTQIPLLGKILTAGSERSLVKTYYVLNGSFASPEMELIPFTSFQKKFIGTFQGILETPTDILMAPLNVPNKN